MSRWCRSLSLCSQLGCQVLTLRAGSLRDPGLVSIALLRGVPGACAGMGCDRVTKIRDGRSDRRRIDCHRRDSSHLRSCRTRRSCAGSFWAGAGNASSKPQNFGALDRYRGSDVDCGCSSLHDGEMACSRLVIAWLRAPVDPRWSTGRAAFPRASFAGQLGNGGRSTAIHPALPVVEVDSAHDL